MPYRPTREIAYRSADPKIVQYPLLSGATIKIGDWVALDSNGNLTQAIATATTSTNNSNTPRILGRSLSDSAAVVAAGANASATPQMSVIMADDQTEFLMPVLTTNASVPYVAATYKAYPATSGGVTGTPGTYYKLRRVGTTATLTGGTGFVYTAGDSGDVYCIDVGAADATHGVFIITETDTGSIGDYFVRVWAKVQALARPGT